MSVALSSRSRLTVLTSCVGRNGFDRTASAKSESCMRSSGVDRATSPERTMSRVDGFAPNCSGSFKAVHPGHGQIGDHDLEPLGLSHLRGELAAWCFDDRIADRKSTRLNSSH